MPYLWSDKLFALGRDKAFELLPFTKDVPLNIHIDGPLFKLGQNENIWDKWKPFMSRAWRIANEDPVVDDTLTVMTLLSSEPLPQLRTVNLMRYGPDALDEEIPDMVMANHPNLRYLSMTSVFICPPPHGGLLSLEIDLASNIHVWQRPSYALLIRILNQNCQLQHLDLRGELDDAGAPGRRLLLPALTSLHLYHTNYMHSILLLDSLHIPVLRKVSVQPEDAFYNVENALHLYRSLLGAWTYAVGVTIRADTSMPTGSLVTERRHTTEISRRTHDSILRECIIELSDEMELRFSITEYAELHIDGWYVGHHTIQCEGNYAGSPNMVSPRSAST